MRILIQTRQIRIVAAVALAAACRDGPTAPNGLGGPARRLSVGEETVCALDGGGALYCWGLNSTRFEYGVPPTVIPSSTAPIRLSAPSFSTLAIGPAQHMCGIASDHTAFCWGRSGQGELGGGSAGNVGNSYTQVLGNFWASISVQRLTTCGVTTLGTGLCWGTNQRGEIGTNNVPINTNSTTPVPIAVGNGVKFKRVVTGWVHACGIMSDDTVQCWGDNRSGQLGLGRIDEPNTPPATNPSPAPIASNEKFAELSLGAVNTCGITLDHRAFCWGENATGQLGDGTVDPRGTPAPVAGGLKFVAIAVGSGFAGGTTVPVPITGLQGAVAHVCAIAESGAPYCWGWNGAGQVGDGTTTERLTPSAVAGGLTLTSIGAGGSSTCGMRGNAVWCWGSNTSGQLGNATVVSSSTPVPVKTPFNTP